MGERTGISGFGTTLSGAVTGTIGRITSLSISGMTAERLDVTTMDSPNAWREFIAGLLDAGELTLDLVYENENHDVLQDALGSDPEEWTITFPDGSAFYCEGFIADLGIEIPMEDKITQSVTIKFSGQPTFSNSSSA